MKKILIFIAGAILFLTNAFAGNLTIELKFPKKSTAKISAPAPLPVFLAISGSLLLDISPYPPTGEKDRYTVEYFLDDVKIYETTGFSDTATGKLDFKYAFDSTKYENGKHKLIVNFWDTKGQSAIGIREITIKNEN